MTIRVILKSREQRSSVKMCKQTNKTKNDRIHVFVPKLEPALRLNI